MDFPFFELHGWGKKSGIQPKTIYSEIPKTSCMLKVWMARYSPNW